ncbi:UNVERIFIED_CONTAM: hypothetical protein K2H54_011081 [Gekko kuhli]
MEVPAGVAPIRAPYLTTKEEFHAYLEKEDNPRSPKGDTDGGGGGGDNGGTKDISSDLTEPPPKVQKLEEDGQEGNPREEAAEGLKKSPGGRKRARGQNKNRPCMNPMRYEKHRLCPSIIQERVEKCFFGTQCRFLHDVKEYMATKPPDLGDSCVLFKNFGRCMYGVTCRFSGAHLGEDHRNVVNVDLLKQWEGRPVVKNSLSKELQQRLRKKKVAFEKSNQYLRCLGKPSRAAAGGNDATNCSLSRGGAEGAKEGVGVSEREEAALEGTRPTADPAIKTAGAITDEDIVKLRPCEKKKLDLQGKLYLAPLTTCGNLPFRRICKRFGADVTCGEMAVCTNLLQGQSSEWALLKRHHTEDLFGVQLEGAFPDTMTKCAELLSQAIEVDFVDINVGCPIDLVYKKGGGCALMSRANKFEQIVRGMNTGPKGSMVGLCLAFRDEAGLVAACRGLGARGTQLLILLILVSVLLCLSGLQSNLPLGGDGNLVTFQPAVQCLNHLSHRNSYVNQTRAEIRSCLKSIQHSEETAKENKSCELKHQVLDVPLTVKIRTGVQEKVNLAHKIIPNLREWGASLVTLHGRSREQRYTKGADWEYIAECAKLASPMPLFGNGDILSYEDADRAMQTGVSGVMIARGALIKPWIFTEIKEQRHWDISSGERLDLLKDFTGYGLEHWGSDTQGVEKTRKFLLEWLSFLCRYIPAGLLERLPQRINERPPYYMGRDYLETLMASQNVGDWIKIRSEMLGGTASSPLCLELDLGSR